MGKKYGSAIDLQKNELQNAVIQNLGGAPSNAKVGQVWYDTNVDRPLFKGGATVLDLTDRATHSGTQPASTISNLAAVVKAYRLDEFAGPSSPLSVNGQRVINGATPTQPGDLVTKSYVDNLINGVDWKASVRAATTANITLSGLQTIDSVSLLAGDRVLVKNQSTASQNGVYIVAAGSWSRAPDSDVGYLTSGATVMVTEGVANGDQQWRLITDDPISVGTTGQSWTQIGAVISYTGTNGVQVNGGVISLDTAVAVTKGSQTFGDGATTTFVLAHGLNTKDVIVQVYQVSDGSEIDVEVQRGSVNAVSLLFASAPTVNQMRVVVHG